MPAYPSSKDRPPALRRAARIAAVWGWSYIVTVGALFFLGGVKNIPTVYHWVLFTTIVFMLIGLLELYWRHRLLATSQARWLRLLALNQFFGTLALIWCAGWLYTIDVRSLDGLLPQSSLDKMRSIYATFNMTLTQHVIDSSMTFSKNFCVFVFGGFLFLSQIWVIIRYLRLAPAIEREAALPPILK
jgi:hypothetical protein